MKVTETWKEHSTQTWVESHRAGSHWRKILNATSPEAGPLRFLSAFPPQFPPCIIL